MSESLPGQARVVVVGGGIVGCSVAYHLTQIGWKDVVLLERKKLASGTTWAAAGLVGQLWASKALTRLAIYGATLYAGLEKETGQPTGWRRSGSIRVARTREREQEFDRAMDMAHGFGIPMEKISLAEARRLFPVMNTDDLVAAWHQPDDGCTNPEDTTQALAKGARGRGARILQGVAVTGILQRNGAVCGVATDRGDIACECVALCAGMWSWQIGRKAGVAIPLHAAEHMHMTTNPIAGVTPGMPYLRDMDGCIYIKEEMGGLLMGGFEPVARPWTTRDIPDQFEHTKIQDNMELLEEFMVEAVRRVPAFASAELTSITTVPESFTPDTAYMLGEVPALKNLFVATGMNSVGIASAAGAGKALAQWMVQGYPEEDLWAVDVRRFNRWQGSLAYVRDRVVESVGVLYADHWPFRQRTTARQVRCSPFHDRLRDRGACFGVVAGWERANWFAPRGVPAQYEYHWGRQNWFEYSRAEHMAVRENVGVYDLTSLAKFLVQGKDAASELQRLCANNVDVAVGKVVYTQMLNDRGGIESDLTVTRLAEDRFFVVCVGATATRDYDWIDRRLDKERYVTLTDVTSGYSMLGVMGPRSRELLTTMTGADLSNAAFPFATAQFIDVGYAQPLALRMTFVGELGWELYCPTEFSLHLFDTLAAAGETLGLAFVGLHALDSLRLEKSYKHWSADITPDDTPIEAGLGFCVDMEKGDFIGRDALRDRARAVRKRKLVTFTIDDPEPLVYHSEPIYRNGTHEGEDTHGAYAHRLGRAIGMTYLHNPQGISDEWIRDGRYEISVAGKRYPITVHLKPPYDPAGARIRM